MPLRQTVQQNTSFACLLQPHVLSKLLVSPQFSALQSVSQSHQYASLSHHLIAAYDLPHISWHPNLPWSLLKTLQSLKGNHMYLIRKGNYLNLYSLPFKIRSRILQLLVPQGKQATLVSLTAVEFLQCAVISTLTSENYIQHH